MISDLPPPDHTRLGASPLEVVVWHLQFAEPADVSPATVGHQVAAALGAHTRRQAHLTRLTPPTVTLSPGAGGEAPPRPDGDAINGWQVRVDELVVTLGQTSLAVETTRFHDWPTFQQVVEAVVAAFSDAVPEPPGEQRLGLRYVDRIARPEVRRITDWETWLEPWLLGVAAHPQLSGSVLRMAQQIDCDAGDGLSVTIRQRAFNDMERRGQPTMLLDFDAFRDGYRSFAQDDVLSATEELNDISHRLFRAAITDRMYDALREEPDLR